MSNTASNPVDQGLSENIRLSASIARVLILVGERQHDRFVGVNQDGKPCISSLEGVVCSALNPLEALWVYDPANAIPALSKVRPDATLQGDMPTQTEASDKRVEKERLLPAFMSMKSNEQTQLRMALLIDASLLFEDAVHPRDTEHTFLQAIEHFSRTQPQNGKLLILRTANLSSIPQALTSSPAVRVVSLPAAARDERMAYAQLRGKRLAEQCKLEITDLARLIANVTDDWRLEDMEGLIKTCEQQEILSPTELEATARAFRLGVARSPWAGAEIQAAIEKAKEQLSHRVRGQPEAISAVCTALLNASVGLSGAHQSGMSRGPRATLFFAGPTGTGKTELAKAIAELVFGDESALVRFDCAEFRQDHSVARLIGAPPGYVGFESGGELTDRIRSNPHSVLLFDEIEKAHPRLLDIFLSILDDGRLTNGQGVTTNFSETILIFTSNLGIYEEVTGDKGNVVRRPRFDLNAEYSEIQLAVRNAIGEEFITTLGRPELLGRLGGERALIVFDYLRDLTGVAEKFIKNTRANVKRLQDIDLTVDASVIEFIAADTSKRPDALALGARGMVQSLYPLFINPLGVFISENKAKNCQVLASVDEGSIKFSNEDQGSLRL
jgi:ATP-dependent Clp protease ATP-binding subunit ClpA